MDNEKFVAQPFSSPLKSRISTLPTGAKTNWYYDHESDDVDKASILFLTGQRLYFDNFMIVINFFKNHFKTNE